jgi:ferredoxin-nitrite reductase
VAEGFGAPGAVYFRLALGGITGHRDFARETGVIIPPAEANRVAAAILRVFIAHGDRTNRLKARMKYLLDRWGLPKFLAEVEKELGGPLTRVDADAILPRPPQMRHGHIGVHAQKQAGLNYAGVLCPVGRLTSARMRGLADIAERYGSGTLRLTVWQNLLISDIPDAKLGPALAAIETLGLHWQASGLRGGLVACTGNAGCKFALGNTKAHAAALVDWLEPRITLDRPVNIHLTGCPHSCAQHYIADIGLLATKVEVGEDMVEGYDLLVGGGAGPDQRLGRLVREKVPFEDLPPMVLGLLEAWQRQRSGPDTTFQDFAAALPDEALAAIAAREAVPA